MTKSSVRKLNRTRRIVASSGIAAALLTVAPVAVAAAEDSPSGSSSESDSSSKSDDSQSDSTSNSDDGDGDSVKKDDAGDESGSPGSPSDEAESVGEKTGDETAPAEKSETSAENTAPPSAVETTPDVRPTDVTTPAKRSLSVLPRPDKTYTVPGLATPDHERDSDGPRKPRKVAGPVDAATPAVPAEPLLAPVVLDADERESETAYITALPIKKHDGKQGFLSAFTSATGKGGLILLNQSAVVLGVLNRRSRGDGSDYLGILGPGERLTLPTQVVATGSLGKHTWDQEAEGVELDEPVVQSFLSRSVVAFDVVVPDTVDEGNLFYDNTDADYFPVAGAPSSYVPYSVDGDPAAAGISYRASDDGETITITNNGTNAVAIGDSASSTPGSVVIVEPGNSADFATSDSQTIVVQGQRVGADGVTPEAGGTPVVLGRIVISESSLSTSVGSPENSNGDAIPNAVLHDWAGLDPDDRFLDGADDPSLSGTPTFETPEGVTYEVSGDGSTITFHNDSGRDIGVLAVNMVNQGPVGDGIYVIGAGDSAALPLPADATYYMVQADRTVSGPIVLGAVYSFDGQTVSPPFGVNPPIKTVGQASVDPEDTYLDPYDADFSGAFSNPTVEDWYHDGVYYSRDETSTTIHNDSDESVGVLVTTGAAWQLDVIEPGGEKTYAPSGVDNPIYLYVQAPRRDDGSAAPYGYIGINFDGATTQVVSGDLNSSDDIAAMGTAKWVDPDPDDRFWDTHDGDLLGPGGFLYPAAGVYGELSDGSVDVHHDTGTNVVTVANNGESDIAVLDYDAFEGKSTLMVIPAGESRDIDISWSPRHVLVLQGERTQQGQPVIYGFARIDGSVIVFDAAGIMGASTPTGPYTGTVTTVLGDGTSYYVYRQPEYGRVVVDQNTGEYVYTPNPGVEHAAAGLGQNVDAFILVAMNGENGRIVPVQVSITPQNENPVAPETVSGGYTGSVSGTDGDDDALTYVVSDGPEHGTVVVNADGSFTYTPDAGVAHGAAAGGPASDEFTVTVGDGHGGTDTSVVAVAITPENENPVVSSIVGGTADPVTGAVTYTMTTTDGDGDNVTYTVAGDGSGGTIVDNGDGTFTYTPDANQTAGYIERVTVTIQDGHAGLASETITVVVPAKQAPEPEQNFFERVFAAFQGAVSSLGKSVSAAWSAFLEWLIGLFSQQESSSSNS